MTENDRRYFIRLIQLIRDANQRCSKASEAWNRANDEFNIWYRHQFPQMVSWKLGDVDGIPTDPLHYAKIKKENLALNDAEAEWSHWQREVVRLTAALQAEQVVRELLGHPIIPVQWNGPEHAVR